MILAIFGFILVVWLAVSGMIRSDFQEESSMHILNAKWIDDTAKFRLVSRWGVKG